MPAVNREREIANREVDARSEYPYSATGVPRSNGFLPTETHKINGVVRGLFSEGDT